MRTWTLLVLMAVLPAAAQEYRGTILGRVVDPTGAAVVGASVSAQNLETKATVKTASNESGNYQIPFLLPGDYLVEVEMSGFKKLEERGVHVATNQKVTLDLTLAIGATTDSVTVTTTAAALNTASADLGQVMDHSYVGMVSVSLSRNVMNLEQLVPGVTGTTGTYTSSAQTTVAIAGGGGKQGGNEVIVDGMPNTTTAGTYGFIPSVDSTAEVKVHSTMFDASLGHSNGGAISVTTRGGGNDIHGAVYLFKQWGALNAASWTNNSLGLPKPATQYRQLGYTVSGPVFIPKIYNGRNRTFFSTSLERDHDPRELLETSRVPTAAERGGDFSQTIALTGGALAIYDPTTTKGTGSAVTRTAFPGAKIPASRLSPIGLAVLNLFPEPNQAGVQTSRLGVNNWGFDKTYTVDQRQTSVRIDHVINDRQRFFARVGVLNRLSIPNGLFLGAQSFPIVGTNNIGTTDNRRTSIGLDDTIILSPTFVGSIRVGALTYSSNSGGGAAGADPSVLKLPDILVSNQAVRGFPNFTLNENLPTIGSTASFTRQTVYSVLSNWTKLKGDHSINFGVDFRQGRVNTVNPGANAVGSFTISPTFTQADPFTPNSANTTGTAMATLLLGLADTGNFGFTSPASLKNNYAGLFAQDAWKVSPRLTVNVGLRWELETPYTERYNRASYKFDQNAALPVTVPGLALKGGILFAGVNGNPRADPLDTNNFGPRLGFAYSPMPKTVVRGGYGIFYSTIAVNTSFFGAVDSFNALTPYIGSIDSLATPYTTLANPFPTGLQQPVGSSIGLLASVGNSVSFFKDNRVNPYNQQWQFSVQQELPWKTVFELAYMGMSSLKEIESFNMNEIPDQYLAQGKAANNAVTNPFYKIFPTTSTLGQGPTITQNRLWVRYPQFTSATVQGENTGRAIYHSLQARADKRLSHGFNMLFNYTLSKAMVNNMTSLVNERHYRAISPLDQKHVFRLGFTYEMPFRFSGGGFNHVLNQAFGGWATAGFASYASGIPMSVTQANGRPLRIANPALSGSVESRLGDRRDSSGRVVNPYFDTSAFLPLASQYVVSPEPPLLDELRAPPTRSLNLNLFKTFSIYERFKLQIKMEANSVTNTPNFGTPGLNMSQPATFGVINSATGNRSMQGSARLVF